MARFLITADEIMEELGVSRSYAYKLMQKLNEDLAAKGFAVIKGKVSRKYFMEQFYGMEESYAAGNAQKGV